MNPRPPRVALALALVLLLGLLLSPSYLEACGVERWSVKTGTDADVGKINVNSSTANTIATMRSWTTPSPIPANNRVSPFETTVWVLSATLTQYKLEDDQDYHLILKDAGGLTMIAEIPDPACVGTGSPFAAGVSRARSAFDARFNATTSFQTANIPVQIKGVGMFDFQHGQTGVAPNGIELHAVLDIVFNPTTDFSIGVSPTSLSTVRGNASTATVSTSVSGGFNSSVALSASGLPSGASASFSPTSIGAPGSGSSTITLSSGTAAAGTYSITITGTGGGKTHSVVLSWTVTSGTVQQLILNPGFESGGTSWTATAGVITNSTSEAAHGGTWKAWLDGYGAAHTDTLFQQVTIPSTITTATLTFWLHIDTAETTTTTAFDTLKVQITNSSGTVLQTLATYSNLNHNSGFSQKSFNLSSFKGQTIRVLFTGIEGSIQQTSFVVDDFALNVQ